MQRMAFKLLTALAFSLCFPGSFKDTRSSAGLLVSPAAKPYSVLVTPSWTTPTWSAAVAVFEFKPHASQDELDVMMGQVSNGVARSAARAGCKRTQLITPTCTCCCHRFLPTACCAACSGLHGGAPL